MGRLSMCRTFARHFFPPFVLLTLGLLGIYVMESKRKRAITEQQELHAVSMRARLIARTLRSVAADIGIVVHHWELRQYVETRDEKYLDGLSDELMTFMKQIQSYRQARLIDETGREIMRVNIPRGEPCVVPKEELQSKKHRGYVEETLKLGRGDVYLSRFDLNMEHGMIERPLVPTIRVATPVFGTRGRKRGIMVLNFSGAAMLGEMDRDAALGPGRLMLLNADGYWLKGARPEDEWGFMFEERRDKTFGRAYPETWTRIKSGKSGQFLTSEGMATFATVDPLGEANDSGRRTGPESGGAGLESRARAWKLVSLATPAVLAAQTQRLRVLLLFAYGVLGSLLAAGAGIMTSVKRKRSLAERTLEEREGQLRAIVETAVEAIFTSNSCGSIVLANPAMCELFGCEFDEILGRNILDLLPLVPQANPPFDLLHTIRTSGRKLIRSTVEMNGTRRNGESFPLSLSISEFVLGGAMYFTGIIQDHTERKSMEEQLLRAQKLESIGQLAAGIAHEINTPTQYVGDNTRFLQDAFADLDRLVEAYKELLSAAKRGPVPPETVERTEEAFRAADADYLATEIPKAIEQSLEGVSRVSKLVQAMKAFSHPGQDEKSPVDLNGTIKSTVTVSRNEWKYVADMKLDLDPDLPMVPCLVGEFNQVVLNIIVNAAHAIEALHGGDREGKGVIAISTRRDGNWVEVRIADSGTGIPEEIRSRIFDPFFTTKEVGKGSGQGLAIAHAVIADKHGGTIGVETEPGRGTTFVIRLPLEAEPVDAPRMRA